MNTSRSEHRMEDATMTSLLDAIREGDNHPKDLRFPHAPAGWTRAAALKLARQEGLAPGETIGKRCARCKSILPGTRKRPPSTRELHDALDEKFHAKGGRKYLFQLFPRRADRPGLPHRRAQAAGGHDRQGIWQRGVDRRTSHRTRKIKRGRWLFSRRKRHRPRVVLWRNYLIPSFCLMALTTASLEVALTFISMPSFW